MSSNLADSDVSGVIRAKAVVGRIIGVTATLDGAGTLGESNPVLNFDIN